MGQKLQIALTLTLVMSGCLAASIEDKSTRGSKQLFLVPNVAPNWDSLAYGGIPIPHTIPVAPETSSPHGKLFGLASLLAGASRQCPTCPTCPATTTCATCATCATCPTTATLTSFANTCPTTTLTAPNGVVAVPAITNAAACTFTISLPAPFTRIRIFCPGAFSYAGAAAANTVPVQANIQGTIIDVQASPTATNLGLPPSTLVTTTGPIAILSFPAAAAAQNLNAFACAWQGI